MTINTKELRIGNLVYSSNSSLAPLTDITIGLLNSIHEGYRSAEPIPLTEEWLLKLGFENNYPIASREYFISREGRKYYCKVIDHYETGFLFIMDYWEAGRMIKYVHQLQNLYFAITGEELPINKKIFTNAQHVDFFDSQPPQSIISHPDGR